MIPGHVSGKQMKAAMLNGIGIAPSSQWQDSNKKPLPKLKEPIYDFNGRNKNRNRNLPAKTMKTSPRPRQTPTNLNQISDPSVNKSDKQINIEIPNTAFNSQMEKS